MPYIPTPEQALALTMTYNKEEFHINHAKTVGHVMGEFAKEYDPDRVDFWTAVGILHDIDFEQWPEQHCVKADSLLRELAESLQGKPLTEETVEAFANAILSDINPRDSWRASKAFRQHIALEIAKRCLVKSIELAGGELA